MNNEPIFAGLPLMAFITNFSPDGNFEKIYVVMKEKKEYSGGNEIKRRALPTACSVWNGPAAAKWRAG
jgi:hypothetical protein